MEQGSRVYEAQLRFARHYVDVARRANTDYLRGFESSIKAVMVFNEERVQIDSAVTWLMRHADDDEVGRLFIKLLRDSCPMLTLWLPPVQLREWAEHTLAISQRLGDKHGEGMSWYALGWVAHITSDHEQAQVWLEQARAVAEQVDDLHVLAASLHVLGQTLQNQGRFDPALPVFEKSFTLYQQLGDARGMRVYYHVAGDRRFRNGQWDEALHCFEQAYEMALQMGGYREISNSLTTIGIVYKSQGRYVEAADIFQRALEFSTLIQFPTAMVYALHALADTYASLGDLPAAREHFVRALHIGEQSQLETVPEILAELGRVAYLEGQLDEAAHYLQTALERHRAAQQVYNLTVDLSLLTLVYAALGDFAAAKRALLEDLELTVRLSVELWTLNLIATAIEYGVNIASNADKPASMEVVARWAGLLLAHPAIDLDKVNLIARLRPRMNALLGAERAAELLRQGEQLMLEDVIAEIRSYAEVFPA